MPPPAVFMGGGYFGLGKQTAQGTPHVPVVFAPFDGETFNPNLQTTQKGTGVFQGTAYSYVNGFDVTIGQSGVPLTSGFGSQIIYLGVGGTDTISGAGDPYSHGIVYKNDLPWFTVERFFADQNYGERIQDCKMEQFSIAGKMGDWCALDWQATGAYNPKQATPTAVTFDADTYAPMMFRDGAFTLNGVSAVATVAGFSISVKRNLQVIRNAHVYPDFIVPRRRTHQVSIDLLWEATNAPTWYQAITKNGSTTTPTKVPYTGALTLLLDPGATPDHQIQLVIADLRQITAVPKMNPQNLDVQMVTITGFAQVPSGGGDEAAWTSKNAVATAYSA